MLDVKTPHVSMVATYGFCFGVELTMNNIVAGYLYDQFELDLVTAGILASCYGLMNIFARTIGGLVSDWSSVKYACEVASGHSGSSRRSKEFSASSWPSPKTVSA